MAEIIFTLPRPVDTVGGGNATVPDNAPIQPPQAFVDTLTKLLSTAGEIGNFQISWPNLGIVSFSTVILDTQVADQGAPYGLDLSGNALSAASVNAILAWYAANYSLGAAGDQFIDLSGGTNAAPSGQGLADKATLIANGWTVTTN
jgi:hypothetical protein